MLLFAIAFLVTFVLWQDAARHTRRRRLEDHPDPELQAVETRSRSSDSREYSPKMDRVLSEHMENLAARTPEVPDEPVGNMRHARDAVVRKIWEARGYTVLGPIRMTLEQRVSIIQPENHRALRFRARSFRSYAGVFGGPGEPGEQAQWRAFLRKSRLEGDASLQDVVSALDEFLMPMVEGILRRRTIPSSGTRRPVESVAARLELGECVPRWPARARIGSWRTLSQARSTMNSSSRRRASVERRPD